MVDQKIGMRTANLVVGGGVIGLLIAWYLAERGERVIVVDRNQAGKESSWAGGGILSPLYPNHYPLLAPLVSKSLPEYVSLAAHLKEATGIDCELLFPRLIMLDKGDDQALLLDEETRISGFTMVDTATLAVMEPALAVPGCYACCFPTAQIRPPRFIAALRSALLARGVKVVENCGVLKFEVSGGRLMGVNTTQGRLDVCRAVVSAGAWTGDLLVQTQLSLPISPVKGQMIVFRSRPGLVSNIIVYKHRYLIPRADGQILVGSTIERIGFAKEITNAARSELYAAALELIPELKDYPVEHHWAGLRPGSPDECPYIGEHPAIKGLFVCAGHFRNGFATGPASARLVVDMMLGQSLFVEPYAFRLDRPAS